MDRSAWEAEIQRNGEIIAAALDGARSQMSNAEWWARWSEHCVKVGSHYETRTVDGNDYIVLVPNVPFPNVPFREKA